MLDLHEITRVNIAQTPPVETLLGRGQPATAATTGAGQLQNPDRTQADCKGIPVKFTLKIPDSTKIYPDSITQNYPDSTKICPDSMENYPDSTTN